MTLELTAVHEASHTVVAFAVGHTLGPVTIAGGSAWAGCSFSTPRRVPVSDMQRVDYSAPLVLWPARARQQLERRVIVSMAGDVGKELLAWPNTGRQPERISESAAELLPVVSAELLPVVSAELLPAASTSERELVAAAACDDSTVPSDAQAVAELAKCAHGDDHASASTWLRYLEASTMALVRANTARIEQLAGLLLERRTVGAAAARALLRGGSCS